MFSFQISEAIVSDVKIQILEDVHSCLSRCSSHSELTQQCYCDPFCNHFNDCCFDYNTKCLQNHTELLMTMNRRDTTLQSLAVPPQHKCTLFPFSFVTHKYKVTTPQEFLVVASCPDTWTGSFVQIKCEAQLEDPQREIQEDKGAFHRWFVFDNVGFNYKNIYCAICNGRKPLQLTPSTIKRYFNFRGFITVEMTAGKYTRGCNPVRLDSCPPHYTNSSLVEGCRSYAAHFDCEERRSQHGQHNNGQTTLREFKNPHCYMCNFATSGVHEDPETYFYRCMAPIRKPAESVRAIWTFIPRSTMKRTNTDMGTAACSRSEYYDPLSSVCRQIQCPEGFLRKGYRCLPEQPIPWRSEFLSCSRQDSFLAFQAPGDPNQVDTDDETCLVWKVFAEADHLTQEKHTNLTSIKQVISNLNIGVFKVSYLGNQFIGPSRKLVMLNLTAFQVKQIHYELSKHNATHLEECGIPEVEILVFCEMNMGGFDCSSGRWYTFNEDEVIMLNINNDTVIYGLDNGTYIKPHFLMYYVLYVYIERLGRFKKTTTLDVCGEETLFCPMVTLNSSEFSLQVNATNGTTVVDINGQILLPDEFMLRSNGRQLQICHSTYKHIVLQVLTDSNTSFSVPSLASQGGHFIFNIVTNTLTAVSLVFYLATFVTHCAFPKLRNAHGRAIMQLASSTICAHILSLFNEGYHIQGRLCVTIAFLSHYFWLVSFNWMSIMAFNLANTFAWKMLQKTEDNLTTVLFQPLLGWGLPLLLTLTCLALHYTSFPFEYGTREACWVADSLTTVIVFGLPVGLSLVLNGIFFIVTTKALYSARKRSKRFNFRQDARADLLVCVKVGHTF